MTADADRQDRGRRADGSRLRVWLQDGPGRPGRLHVLREPFRLGFGGECHVRLEGAGGPDVLFEVEPAPGSLLVARALAPAAFDRYVDLRIDGEPLGGGTRHVAPGARLEIVDKTSGRRYAVVLAPRHRGILRARNLALAMLVLALAGAAFGGYLYWSLESAHTEITLTGARVEQAEADLARTEHRLLESLERLEYTEAEIDQAVHELRRLAEASGRAIRAEFAERIQRIERETRDALARLAEQDVQGRGRLREQARRQADALRDELSDRMVESYRQLQALEQRLLTTMARRMSAREPGEERFQRLFARSSKAALLIHTRYQVEFVREQTVSEASTFGTGFLVSPSGLAVTAQHVLFPWRHDEELVMLQRLGLARVVPGSARWQAWRAGARALRDPEDDESVDTSTAYGTHGGRHPLRLLHVPEPELSVRMVSSPLGVIEIPVPVPGPSDSAVLQLVDFTSTMAHLPPTPGTARPVPLDEVLLVGYPFSLLRDGVAAPQAVHGFVRRQTGTLLELDAAVHPGLSGGPVLDRDGAVVGMVMATLHSDVYAVALPLDGLLELLEETRAQVLAEENRLAALGCDPGAVDGEFDARTAEAYRCEAHQGAKAAPVDPS